VAYSIAALAPVTCVRVKIIMYDIFLSKEIISVSMIEMHYKFEDTS
jgi:hypothetical protein